MCLWNLEGCDFSQRQLLCGGEVYFGSLPPGAYGLALCGGEETQALELRLPPGASVSVTLYGGSGVYTWRREWWHSSLNLP
ncbi:MAG TPA: hypothetical protein H9841_05410 [Candidatus Flavonifractor merdigallinarum]|uniref:Uncharacterized protein n=1 Tax=Candidatus Flavonifractor merdigallinarum TaxID=2838589 RepID=A0A9D1Y8A2_9FIRM|nr:hypothetical protein [Candidatus Flavonifractor merdigallinarum]